MCKSLQAVELIFVSWQLTVGEGVCTMKKLLKISARSHKPRSVANKLHRACWLMLAALGGTVALAQSPRSMGPVASKIPEQAVLPKQPRTLAPPMIVAPPQGAPLAVPAIQPAAPNPGGVVTLPPSQGGEPAASHVMAPVPPQQGGARAVPEVQPPVASSAPGATTAAAPSAIPTQAIAPAGPHKVGPPQGASTASKPQTATASAPGSTALSEVLPTASALAMTRQEPPIVNSTAGPVKVDAPQLQSQAASPCVDVTFRPNAQRTDTTLVDLTGDGLIVAAVENTRIHAAFSRAGYASPVISQPVRWCIHQNTARALLQSGLGVDAQHASLLVQTGNGWSLMTQAQWLAQRANTDAVVAAANASAKNPKSTSSRAKRGATTHRPLPVSGLIAKLKATKQTNFPL